MKRTLVWLAALVAAVGIARAAQGRQIKILFWYPGEAGSTEEAQPILDELFTYLNTKVAPDAVSGRYDNTVEGGLAAIRKEKPQMAIISYAAWAQHKGKLGDANVILSTLPAPHGQRTERYWLVGSAATLPPAPTLLSSEPLSAAFVRAELFPDLPAGAKLQSTPQMVAKLKDIGLGKLNASAILTPTEATTLSGISAAWAEGVKRIAPSKPVPTARVVLIDPLFDATKIRAALVGAGADPKARPILDELRLKGFAE